MDGGKWQRTRVREVFANKHRPLIKFGSLANVDLCAK
jgi:hypothetical protein